jgi:hypothetical protein
VQLLPASAFSNLAVWSDAAVQSQLWPVVASALKVQRLARQVRTPSLRDHWG